QVQGGWRKHVAARGPLRDAHTAVVDGDLPITRGCAVVDRNAKRDAAVALARGGSDSRYPRRGTGAGPRALGLRRDAERAAAAFWSNERRCAHRDLTLRRIRSGGNGGHAG